MSARTLRLESINGCPVVEYRLGQDDTIERRTLLPNGREGRDGGSDWREPTRAELLEQPATGPVWEWLREHGITRPSPPGRSGPTTPEDERPGVRMTLRLSDEAARRLDELCERWGCTRTEAITRALLRHGEEPR